jgi:PAS domain S-box-containing protein
MAAELIWGDTATEVMSSEQTAWNTLAPLTKFYQAIIFTLGVSLPLVAILYIYFFHDPAWLFHDILVHETLIGLSSLLSGFVIFVAYQDFRTSRDPFLGCVALAFFGFTLLYATHGLTSRWADEHLSLFLMFGPGARLLMGAYLLMGLLRFTEPPQTERRRQQSVHWWVHVLLIVGLDLAIGLITFSADLHPERRRLVEAAALTTVLLAIFRVLFLWRTASLMQFQLSALLLFAQASLAFLLAQPWNAMWWLAHATFAAGFMVLGYAVTYAYQTTGSFKTTYSVAGLFRQLRARTDELSRSEATLRHQSHLLQSILDSLAEGVMVADPDGRIILANPAAREILGFAAPEDHFNQIQTLLDPFQAAAPTPRLPENLPLARALRGEKVDEEIIFLGQVRPPQGIWLSLSARPLKDGDSARQGGVMVFRDITQRRQTELERDRLAAELQNERARLEQILQQMPIGVSIADAPSGKLLFHNDEAVRLLRHPMRSTDDYEGYAQYGALHADGTPYEPKEYPIARALLHGEIVREEEMRYRRGDGTETFFAVSSAPIRSAAGEILAAVSTFSDISEMKRAEEALRTSESRYRQIMEQASDGIFILSRAGLFVEVNTRICEMLGYPCAELVNHPLSEFLLEEERETYLENLWVGAGGLSERWLRRKEGAPLPVEISARQLPGGRLLAIVRDITERKRAEETRAHLAAIVEYSEDAIEGLSLDGVITNWNRGAERLYGYTAEEVIGQPVSLLVPPERQEEVEFILNRIKRGEPVEGYETVKVCKRDLRKDVALTASPVKDETGQVIGGSVISRDITARKRAEEELRASREQLRALSAHLQSVREQERTSISIEIHDQLGAALTSLKWELELVEKSLIDCVDGKDHSEARESIAAMTNLIDTTISTVRRISAELRPGVLDDLGLIPAIEWQAQQFQARTGIRCRVRTQVEEVALSREKTTVLFRIFQEVLTNVMRHAGATEVSVDISVVGSRFCLEVQDNGRGIRESEKADPLALGILGMMERARSVGGAINITGKAGVGTVVEVCVSLDQPASDKEPL